MGERWRSACARSGFRLTTIEGNIRNKHVIGYTVTALAAVMIGAGVGVAVAPNASTAAAPPACLKALDLADSNFTVLAGAMSSASKIVTAANAGDDGAITVGTAEVNAAGTQMTLGS